MHREYNHANFLAEESSMKWVLSVIAILLFLAGLVWFLQGVNILPGSYMTGDPQWAINGGIAMLIGGIVLYFARRLK